MWSIGMRCLLLGIIVQLCLRISHAEVPNSDARLRVSVRKDVLRRVSSCVKSFSQVELLNLDPTEPVTIHSIEKTAERTVRVTAAGIVETNDVLPEQLHLSRLTSGNLMLQPKQIAIVPMTFIPRYPQESSSRGYRETDAFLSNYGDTAPKLSAAAHADLEQLVGEENLTEYLNGPRNNLDIASVDEEYEIHTTIVFDTSRGIVEFPVVASSVRKNAYKVPEVIRFRHAADDEASILKLFEKRPATESPKIVSREYDSGVIIMSTDDSSRHHRQESVPKGPHEKDAKRDCYDIYLSNPSSERGLSVLEIMISRPDLMAVHVAKNARGGATVSAGPRQSINEWGGGPLLISSGTSNQYTATICPSRAASRLDYPDKKDDDLMRWMDSISPGVSLGHLLIKTDADTLIIGLERFVSDLPARPMSRPHDYLIDDDWDITAGMNKARNQRNRTLDRPDLVGSDDRDNVDVLLVPTTSIGSRTPDLSAHPENVELQIVPTVNTQSVKPIALTNSSPKPVRIMRATVGMNVGKDDFISNALDDLGLQLNITIGVQNGELANTTHRFSDVIIPPGATVLEALVLSCSMSSKSSYFVSTRQSRPFRFNGTIVVRGSSEMDSTHEEWRELLKVDPYRESQLVLEVPYTITIVDGRVHVLVDSSSGSDPFWVQEEPLDQNTKALSALFFPIRRFAGKGDNQGGASESNLTISYELRIISSVQVSLNLAEVEISEGGEVDSGSDTTDVCKQFTISSISELEEGQDNLRSNDLDFLELGTFTLTYSFSRRESARSQPEYDGGLGRSSSDGLTMSKTCYLALSTEPIDTGIHKLPLIVFPGLIDVSASEPYFKLEHADHSTSASQTPRKDFTSSVISGIDDLVSWFRSSSTGSGLEHVFQLFYGRQKKLSIADETMRLTDYLSELGSSSSDHLSLWPALLNVGAIGHGEVQTAPIYLTNRNPVPIQVYVDVGEVEGMSIAIARDETRVRGDGNSILDYFPKIDESDKAQIAEGQWKGHPRHGLRQFLLFSDLVHAILDILPFRDAVSPSQVVVRRDPILRRLYKERATVQFHAHSVPRHLYSSASFTCGGEDQHPPEYMRKMPDRRPDNLGPMLLSGDLGAIRPLAFCRDVDGRGGHHRARFVDPTSDETHPPVTIPPGGVARFDVKVRAPGREILEKDITPFVSTGLVLSTDHGQKIPILATFEALLGQLLVLHGEWVEQTNKGDVGIIDVPMGLFQMPSSVDDVHEHAGVSILPSDDYDEMRFPPIKPGKHDVPLFFASSFSREITLRHVDSCNPWFEVELGKKQASASANIDTRRAQEFESGSLRTVIPCLLLPIDGSDPDLSTPLDLPAYPSFYQCALAWLENRSELQPRGCGLEPKLSRGWSGEGGDYDIEDDAASRAIGAFYHAVHYSLLEYNAPTGRELYFGPPRSSQGAAVREMGNSSEGKNSNVHSSFSTNSRDSAAARKSGSSRKNGYIKSFPLDLFAEAADAWQVIADLGRNKFSSSLRAAIDYSLPSSATSIAGTDATKHGELEGRKQSLTVSMHDLAVRSTLATPKLFDRARSRKLIEMTYSSSASHSSTFDFPPTFVAEVSSLKLPIRNPTSVPVRVRLVSLQKRKLDSDGSYDSEDMDILSDDHVRERFLDGRDGVYVQKGKRTSQNEEGDGQLWWDGDGAFFLPDDSGDLIQSYHNFTLTAGSGVVRLVNPSHHATSAFLIGCGTHCGIRDDNVSPDDVPTGVVNPIGASSAVGIALGYSQSSSVSGNGMGRAESYVTAGGSRAVHTSPSAFAIPFSALDEIILPPYGEAELGPILFRPPGRFNVLGCDSVRSSTTGQSGIKTTATCGSQVFESIVFIENSLTGLERVVLRGQAMWERIMFLDPLPDGKSDEAFGDIEHRYGRSTLVFTGSANVISHERNPNPLGMQDDAALPAIKEVVVHNGGDVKVSFGAVYFSQSPKFIKSLERHRSSDLLTKQKKTVKSQCALRGFRLVDCSESDHATMERHGKKIQNLNRGFTLLPGQNRSLYVEHLPDCTLSKEYVALNFEFQRDTHSGRDIGSTPTSSPTVSSSRRVKRTKAGEWASSFMRRKAELLVGFEMNVHEMAACVPVGHSATTLPGTRAAVITKLAYHFQQSLVPWLFEPFIEQDDHYWLAEGKSLAWAVLTVKICLICLFLWFSCVVANAHGVRRRTSRTFNASLRGVNSKSEQVGGNMRSEDTPSSLLKHGNWPAAFRCLARGDPTSSELQTIGREQARQVILSRYKSLGILPPQCINGSGIFMRDKSGVGPGKRGNGRDGNVGGSEKVLMLSDAIFKGSSLTRSEKSEEQCILPCSLGWRAAVGRGVLNKSQPLSCPLKSKALLLKRHQVREQHQESTHLVTASSSSPVSNTEQPSDNTICDDTNEENQCETDDYEVDASVATTTDETDEQHAGEDVISTSDSEGTAGASGKDEDLQMPPPSLTIADESIGRDMLIAPHEAGLIPQQSPEETSRILSSEMPLDESEIARRSGSPLEDSMASQTKANFSQTNKPKEESRNVGRRRDGRSQNLRMQEGSRDKTSESFVVPSHNETTQRPARAKSSSKDQSKGLAKQKKKTMHSFGTHSLSPRDGGKKKTIGSPVVTSQSASSSAQTSPFSFGKLTTSSRPSSESKRFSPLISGSLEGNTSGVLGSGIRPPPGLSPPPGFGETSPKHDSSIRFSPTANEFPLMGAHDPLPPLPPILASLDQPYGASPFIDDVSNATLPLCAALSECELIRTDTTPSLFPSVEPLQGSTSPAHSGALGILPVTSPSSLLAESLTRDSIEDSTQRDALRAEPTLLGLGSGFNVMDFLDSILDDPNASNTDEGPGDLLTGENHAGGDTALPLLSDPWATERRSRASAYGIAVEDEGERIDGIVHAMLASSSSLRHVPRGNEDSISSLSNSVPLLTPADILAVPNDDSDENGDSGPLYYRETFYASLLKE